ncbi:MAG TPA: lipase maturation factor family protein, partial [Polyangia bacterium]|nr:lipase maturation factor family protein [Polyangia bacterium]
MSRVLDALRPRDHSGPAVARLFHRLLALVFLDAWLSLGVQVHVLIGTHGLLPIARFLDRARGQLSFTDFPTLMWIDASDTALTLGVILGVILSLVALAGRWPRVIAAIQVALYLSFVTAARTFLSFQWDSLLLECAFFAIFLPRDRSAPIIHTLFRLILFKLYWESGVAKWQSHLHDWQDGSAMTHYFETAPLPTWLAWYAHHLPAWWHKLESWATLTFELGVPLVIFVGARRVRLACAAILTAFQLVNAATANYGFFCYLAAALHVFLLDDADVERVGNWLRARLHRARVVAHVPPSAPALRHARARKLASLALLAVFVTVSTADALVSFTDSAPIAAAIEPLRRIYEPWRIINTYHLFGHITTARIEPEFQTTDDDVNWHAQPLWHKPGDLKRRPDFVAPHQPRVDFQLWFYGLGYRSGSPAYVDALVERLCRDPSAVQSLFRDRLPPHPRAVRIAYWHYRFTSAAER